MSLATFITDFDQRFLSALKKKAEMFTQQSDDLDCKQMTHSMIEVSKGGKRIRPYLVDSIYQAGGGNKDIFPILAAIESLHIFALIHDDIMDKGLKRHGAPTIHSVFGTQYQDTHFGNSIAILAGDLMFQWSQEWLQENRKTIDIPAIEQQYALCVNEVIHGQVMDIAFTKKDRCTYEELIARMELKTARYSFVNPLVIGLQLAKANQSIIDNATKFAINLGIAFQIQDDILDNTPQGSTIKNKFQDIATKQQTLFNWFFDTQASQQEKKAFEQFLGNPQHIKNSSQDLLSLLTASGATTYVYQQAQQYFQQAECMINQLPPQYQQVFTDILTLVRNRSH